MTLIAFFSWHPLFLETHSPSALISYGARKPAYNNLLHPFWPQCIVRSFLPLMQTFAHTRSIEIADVMSLVSNRPALFCVRLLTNVFPIVSVSLAHFFPLPLFLPASLLLSLIPFTWYVTLITIFLTCVFAYMFYWAAIISASHFCTTLTLYWGQLPWPDYIKFKYWILFRYLSTCWK